MRRWDRLIAVLDANRRCDNGIGRVQLKPVGRQFVTGVGEWYPFIFRNSFDWELGRVQP